MYLSKVISSQNKGYEIQQAFADKYVRSTPAHKDSYSESGRAKGGLNFITSICMSMYINVRVQHFVLSRPEKAKLICFNITSLVMIRVGLAPVMGSMNVLLQ